jgi:hypothetical protein
MNNLNKKYVKCRIFHFHETPHTCLKEFYKNVFQNPELFMTQVSLSPEQSTLAPAPPNEHKDVLSKN